ISLWATWVGIQFDQQFFDDLYSRFAQDFGVKPYVIAEESWRYGMHGGFLSAPAPDKSQPIRVDDFYSWGGALTGYNGGAWQGNIAEIGPGYDERLLKGADRTGRRADRQSGTFYRTSWEAAIAARKPYVAIETWNEFHEASDIAETREYGRQYI